MYQGVGVLFEFRCTYVWGVSCSEASWVPFRVPVLITSQLIVDVCTSSPFLSLLAWIVVA